MQCETCNYDVLRNDEYSVQKCHDCGHVLIVDQYDGWEEFSSLTWQPIEDIMKDVCTGKYYL